MKIAAVLMACVAAAMASKDMIATDFDVTKPLALCKAEGDFLLHPTNRCKFIRCTYGPEPFKDEEENPQLYPVVMDCPYGTGVNRAVYGQKGEEYDGLSLRVSSLCSHRVNNFGYDHGFGHGYGYDQCSVVQSRSHGYGHTGYAHAGVAHAGAAHLGAVHLGAAHLGAAPHGAAFHGAAHYGAALHGAAPHGAAPHGAALHGTAYHGVSHHAVAPKVSKDGYVDSGYGYKVFVNHGFGFGYPSYPVDAQSKEADE